MNDQQQQEYSQEALPVLVGVGATLLSMLGAYVMTHHPKELDPAVKAAKHLQAAGDSGTSSLARFAAVSRVEPICIIDSDCMNLEYISDVVQTLETIFAGYYIQSAGLLTKISGVQVGAELGRLNPNRDPNYKKFLLDLADSSNEGYHTLQEENYQWKLPHVSLEAEDSTDRAYNKSVETVETLSNLATGHVYNVTIQTDDKKATVPVTIRLLCQELRSSTISDIFGRGTLDKSLAERWQRFKAGRISFWNDLVLCRDLKKEYQKILMEDKTGVVTEIYQRATKARAAGLTSGKASLATMSNLYVISESTAAMIKRTSGLDVHSFNQRQQIFENIYGMVLAVIDKDYQRVNFYTDSISLPTSVSVKDIKGKKKDSSVPLNEVLTMFKGPGLSL